MKRILLHATAILVLLPSTLVAAVLTLMGLGWSMSDIQYGRNIVAALLLIVGMTFGWFALFTAWRSYVSVARGQVVTSKRVARIALTLGASVSAFFIVASGGGLVFNSLFFGWPLLAMFVLWPYLKDEVAT